jgi:hypothetical protein
MPPVSNPRNTDEVNQPGAAIEHEAIKEHVITPVSSQWRVNIY